MGQSRKLVLATAILCLTFLSSTSAFADATSGGIFVSSGNTNNQLVLTFSDGSKQVLDTAFHPINACLGLTCSPPATPPNQGFWSTTDAVFPDNSNYRAGVGTTGNVYRDFFTFDLTELNPVAPGVTITGASLQVQRYGNNDSGDGFIGLKLGVITGNDANGNPVTALRLNDKGNSADATNMFNAIGGATNSTSFKVDTNPGDNPNDILAFNIASITGAINLGATLVDGHNWLDIGGSTFDIDANSTLPTPTVVPPPAVPEPASLLLLGSGLTGAWLRRRKQ